MISGFLVAWGGMFYTLVFAMALTVLAFLHLLVVRVDEARARRRPHDAPAEPRRVDIAGTIRVIRAVPGLFALILFATLQQLPGRHLHGAAGRLRPVAGLGAGLGLLFGFLSTRLHPQRIIISKTGLGPNPLRTLLLVNLVTWSVCCVFTAQSSIVLLAAGCFVWMLLGPYAEAAEQTTLQKVVPFERQGRVFGFAQSVEQAASPLTAFLIGPLTQFIFIPFMTDGIGGGRHRRLVRRAGRNAAWPWSSPWPAWSGWPPPILAFNSKLLPPAGHGLRQGADAAARRPARL